VREGVDNRPLDAKGWRAIALILCALVALLMGSRQVSAEPESVREYDLKAAYLYNFTKFASWPAGSFSAPQAPLVVAVLGDERLIAALEALTRGRFVNGHPVSVKSWSPQLVTAGLHVLYVDSAHELQLPKMSGAFMARGVLTVGETDAFLAAGGAIRLTVEGDRLQFEISTAATERAGLGLSSQLLMLAKTIRR
jgi:hypothetical protein